MFLFILLILINNKNLIKTNQLQVYYVRENIEVPGSFNGNLISSSKQQSRLSCLILCYLRSDCITLVYDEKSMNLSDCFLYDKYFFENETISSITKHIHTKKS